MTKQSHTKEKINMDNSKILEKDPELLLHVRLLNSELCQLSKSSL